MRKWYALIVALVLTIDRLTKAWAQTVLQHAPGGTVPLIEGVFHFTYVENIGASFGLMKGQFWLFYVLTTIAALVMIWVLFIRPPKSRGMGIAISLLLGGALGNFYDRVFYRYVVDLFDFRLINFAVFNVADSAIVIGIGLFLIFMLIEDKRATAAEKAAELAAANDGAQEGSEDDAQDHA